MSLPIPFNRPCLAGNEYKYIAEAISNGHASGDGPFTRRCHELLAHQLGVPQVLLTTSCTHALEMAAILLNCGPGDEVILPSFTFVSTANAFALRGAKIVFSDIRPDTLNLDESKLEALISPRTKAIVPVHYAGVACEMDTICSIAGRHGIAVVEDNAHGLFAQLEARDQIQAKRKKVWHRYSDHLTAWGAAHGAHLPTVPAECEQAYHMFYLVLPSLAFRQALIAHLKAEGILSVFHYVPLHSSDMGRKCAVRETPCPVTDDVSARLLRLPFYNDLTEADQMRVVAAITASTGK